MIYSLPGSTVISYMGGTFGNSLAALVYSSRTGHIIYPKHNSFHVMPWVIDPIDSTIHPEKALHFRREVTSEDIIQLHCLNASLVVSKFPESKVILLTCDSEDEYFAIQRQWQVCTNLQSPSIETILSAWDWIEYNLTYYNQSGRNFKANQVLSVEWKSVLQCLDKIFDFLNITVNAHALEIYMRHIDRQMSTFYNRDKNFEFAWQTWITYGADAKIQDLAKEYLQ